MRRIAVLLGLAGTLLGWGRLPADASAPKELGEAHCHPTGSLAFATHGETILLPSGKVLAVGGNSRQAELYDPSAGTWTLTGGPSTYYGRAVLLPSGKVLSVGSLSSGNPALEAKFYDPQTETWAATGSPIAQRFGFTLTLLASGKVLLAGGAKTGLEGVASAELFDPATGSWKTTGSLAAPREFHTSTLLPSGKVLVVGGWLGNLGFAKAELYDERTGRWSSAGSLKEGRYTHTATLLASGKVLVVGGLRGNAPSGANLGYPTVTELYDPATGQWSVVASPRNRCCHKAVLLPSGKVLLAGGQTETTFDRGTVLYDPTSGTWSQSALLTRYRSELSATLLPSGSVLLVSGRSAEIYDPGTSGSWGLPAPLSIGRDQTTATLLPSGKVLVAGGESGNRQSPSFGVLATCELYDPATAKWSNTGSLTIARKGHTATLLPSGKVLVTGGDIGGPSGSPGSALASAELYDPATGRWEPTGNLTTPRRNHTATLLPSGKVLVVGGRVDQSLYSSAEVYDPATGKWSAVAPLHSERSSHAAVLLSSGQVLVVGGTDDGVELLSSADIYEPLTDTWSITGPLSEPRIWGTATLLPSGRVLLAGGQGNVSLAATEIYDPDRGTWTPTGSLNEPRAEHSAILLPSGKVLVAGGFDRDGSRLPPATELYDPATGAWENGAPLGRPRVRTNLVLLPSGRVLLIGGDEGSASADVAAVEFRDLDDFAPSRRPIITSAPAAAAYGSKMRVTGSRFRGDPPASSFPQVQLMSLENQQVFWLTADPRLNLWDDPMTLDIGDLPVGINPGWYRLTVVASGRPSESKIVSFPCSVAISQQPADQTVPLGGSATFRVKAPGGRAFQWLKDGFEIPGATAAVYSTPPVSGADSGTRYRVRVDSGCASTVSNQASLVVEDHETPTAAVLAPAGGEYWLLSEAGAPSRQSVTWTMADNVRVCRAEVSLWFSKDGGATYAPAPAGGGLPANFGTPGACASPGETHTSLEYEVPVAPPSGVAGSLYRIQVKVIDHAGLSTIARSQNPFYIVRPNPDLVRTLILFNTARMQSQMGITPAQASALFTKLQDLARHPRVLGLLVDLDRVTDLSSPTSGLYAAWDADQANPEKANRVLFGCHAPLPADCRVEKKGIHDLVLELARIYTGVKHVVLVGDDRIVPLARLLDRTTLLPESRYLAGGDLTATSTTVGKALASNHYLSDDPLGVLSPFTTKDLEDSFFIPDLALGRLVETPEEISTTIATFISQDGILDLQALDAKSGHKVLVTGYDFLLDVGRTVRERWRRALHVPEPYDDAALAPVDGQLLTPTWSESSTAGRRRVLRTHLSGNGGSPYAVAALNGHATHYQEGIPGGDALDIQGLGTIDFYGVDRCGSPSLGNVNLSGTVIYAMGCHSGLPVPGSCARDPDHSLDLAQTFLSRGAQIYVANTGYGWGLLHGIGYGERLVQILTEELSVGGLVVAGDAVKRSKLRYLLEAPRFDPYDEKSLMQWTVFGLPMYSIKTGAPKSNGKLLFSGLPTTREDRIVIERNGSVMIERWPETGEGSGGEGGLLPDKSSLPSSLTRLDLHFDFTGPEVFIKRNALGDRLPLNPPGCPPPVAGAPPGCYYTLNGLVERGTGTADLPILPYFVYDSRLSGASQHGLLWKGGTFEEEKGWVSVLGELVSNGGDGSDHGATPRHIIIKPQPRRPLPGGEDTGCRTTDLEVSSLVVPAGEALKERDSSPTYTIQRRYREVDLEVFYFNNTLDGFGNCDRTGPDLGIGLYAGAYHQVTGPRIDWAVSPSDEGGIWRVVVVYSDGKLDAQGRGYWIPLDLTEDSRGVWRASLQVSVGSRLTYVLQAVDRRGNVSWLEDSSGGAASGVPFGVPLPVDVSIGR